EDNDTVGPDPPQSSTYADPSNYLEQPLGEEHESLEVPIAKMANEWNKPDAMNVPSTSPTLPADSDTSFPNGQGLMPALAPKVGKTSGAPWVVEESDDSDSSEESDERRNCVPSNEGAEKDGGAVMKNMDPPFGVEKWGIILKQDSRKSKVKNPARQLKKVARRKPGRSSGRVSGGTYIPFPKSHPIPLTE
ncbi:12245_t:CDS:2, partial [Acaulospora colombiana]